MQRPRAIARDDADDNHPQFDSPDLQLLLEVGWHKYIVCTYALKPSAPSCCLVGRKRMLKHVLDTNRRRLRCGPESQADRRGNVPNVDGDTNCFRHYHFSHLFSPKSPGTCNLGKWNTQLPTVISAEISRYKVLSQGCLRPYRAEINYFCAL